jgi:hypothetical protein
MVLREAVQDVRFDLMAPIFFVILIFQAPPDGFPHFLASFLRNLGAAFQIRLICRIPDRLDRSFLAL